MKIVVFSKEKGFCPRCKMTKKWLSDHNVKFTEKDIYSGNNEALVKSKNFKSAPVVEADNWKIAFSGFNPAMLAKLAKKQNNAQATV